MTKRNAHALQRRYTKLLARTTAVTSARLQFGQGVTGRRPWSVWLSMLGPHRVPHGTCQLNHKRFAPSCGTSGPVARPKSLHAIPLVYLVGFTRGALWHRRSRMAIAQALVCALRATAGGLRTLDGGAKNFRTARCLRRIMRSRPEVVISLRFRLFAVVLVKSTDASGPVS